MEYETYETEAPYDDMYEGGTKEKVKNIAKGTTDPWVEFNQTSPSRLNLEFKILTKPSFSISTKIQLHNLFKTSAAKY